MISRSVLALVLLFLGVIVTFAVDTNAEKTHRHSSTVDVDDPYKGGGKPPKPHPTPKPKPVKPVKPMKPKPVKPTPTKPTAAKHSSTGVHAGKKPILPGVPTPLPHVNPKPVKPTPAPVSATLCAGVCQDSNSISCSTGYQTGLCPGAANIQCCPTGDSSDYDNQSNNGESSTGSATDYEATTGSTAAVSDATIMAEVQSQSNTRVSVGTYSGVPNGFYTTAGGALVFQGKMDTDCDGAPSCPSIDPDGQTTTSFNYQGQAIDALKANYIVLPSDLSKKLGSHIKLGDIVAVGYNGNVAYAIYADNGPLGKAGEGSVHLTLQLGFNPYCGSKVCSGISSGVSYVVFPGSRSQYGSPYDSATIASVGAQLLRAQVNN